MTLLIAVFLIVTAQVSAAQQRFTDNGDGTVTDHQTKLMWGKTDNQGRITWRQAEKWVKYTFPLTVSTPYEDWRLPTTTELKTLFVEDQSSLRRTSDCGMKVRIVPDIKITCGWIWSSQTKDISATVFSFKEGYVFSELMMQNKVHRALPVRSLK